MHLDLLFACDMHMRSRSIFSIWFWWFFDIEHDFRLPDWKLLAYIYTRESNREELLKNIKKALYYLYVLQVEDFDRIPASTRRLWPMRAAFVFFPMSVSRWYFVRIYHVLCSLRLVCMRVVVWTYSVVRAVFFMSEYVHFFAWMDIYRFANRIFRK